MADAITSAPANEVSNGMGDTATQVATQFTETANQSTSALRDTFESFISPMIAISPNIVAMVLILVLGYIMARVTSRVITALCDKIGLHTAAERTGLVTSMKQVGIERTVPQIIGVIFFWLMMCVFLMAACNILGLVSVSLAIQGVVEYIPKLLVASVIVVVGLLLATFLRGVIATSADRLGISYAQQLAAGCYYLMGLMVFMAVFDQLDIKFALLNQAILIAFGAVALGFGLSVGLGGRDVMGGILAGYYVRQRMQAGDHVAVAGFDGTVREVGPVSTIIESEENGLLHRRSIPNIRMLNEGVR